MVSHEHPNAAAVEGLDVQPLDPLQPLDPKISEHRCGPRENCKIPSNWMGEMMIPAIILACPASVYFAQRLVAPDEFNFRFPAAVYAAILHVAQRVCCKDITGCRDITLAAVRREVERVEVYDYSDQFAVLYQLRNFGRESSMLLGWFAADVRNRGRLRRLEREAWGETEAEAFEGCDAAGAAQRLAERAAALAREWAQPRQEPIAMPIHLCSALGKVDA